MMRERTMRCIEECQERAEQIREELSNTITVVNVFCLNLQIDVSNLQQSKADKATIVEIGKYILKRVYDPLTDKPAIMEASINKLNKVNMEGKKSSELVLKNLLSVANNLVVDISFIRKQLNQSYLSLKLHNARINRAMSNSVEEMENIIERLDGIIGMLHDEIKDFEDILDSIAQS